MHIPKVIFQSDVRNFLAANRTLHLRPNELSAITAFPWKPRRITVNQFTSLVVQKTFEHHVSYVTHALTPAKRPNKALNRSRGPRV